MDLRFQLPTVLVLLQDGVPAMRVPIPGTSRIIKHPVIISHYEVINFAEISSCKLTW